MLALADPRRLVTGDGLPGCPGLVCPLQGLLEALHLFSGCHVSTSFLVYTINYKWRATSTAANSLHRHPPVTACATLDTGQACTRGTPCTPAESSAPLRH